MLNVLATECMKLRRDKMIWVCTIIAIVLPIFMFWYEAYSNSGVLNSSALAYARTYQLMIYPILSGLVLTFLLNREYNDHTLTNTLTAPVSRTKFLWGKIIIWVMWYIVITLIFFAIMCADIGILFGSAALRESAPIVLLAVVRFGLLNMATLTPVVWVAVLQRSTFYPSLLCTMIFMGVGFMGLYGPRFLGNIVPWIATFYIGYGIQVIPSAAYTSIAICAIFGISAALYTFKRQEL